MNKEAMKIRGREKKNYIKIFKRDVSLWMFVLPGLIITFIFSYIPMYGVQIAFRNYNLKKGFLGSTWVGLQHFERFFNSPFLKPQL